MYNGIHFVYESDKHVDGILMAVFWSLCNAEKKTTLNGIAPMNYYYPDFESSVDLDRCFEVCLEHGMIFLLKNC